MELWDKGKEHGFTGNQLVILVRIYILYTIYYKSVVIHTYIFESVFRIVNITRLVKQVYFCQSG